MDGDVYDHDDEADGEEARERATAAEAAFLEALLACLSLPSDRTRDSLRSAADGMNALGGDRFTYGISWSREIDLRLGHLANMDAATWGALLHGLGRRVIPPGDTFAERFREASPFRGKLVVFAAPSSVRDTRYYGDVAPLVEHALAGVPPVAIDGHVRMYVADRPAFPTEPCQPDEDGGSVGC